MKDKIYITPFFPYPSGSGLHIGHFYNYAIIDSYCNYWRYKGNEVFQPFCYDSFGLPAENYAKKVGRDPKDVTMKIQKGSENKWVKLIPNIKNH